MHDVVKVSTVKRVDLPAAPELSAADGGGAMHDMVSELYPICRRLISRAGFPACSASAAKADS
jgi:hypothetical protein